MFQQRNQSIMLLIEHEIKKVHFSLAECTQTDTLLMGTTCAQEGEKEIAVIPVPAVITSDLTS